MSAEVTFVGDTTIPAVAEMLEWLSKEKYKTQALDGSELPERIIPVILDHGKDDFVVRINWPAKAEKPNWCKNAKMVLAFKPYAIRCCKDQIRALVSNILVKA